MENSNTRELSVRDMFEAGCHFGHQTKFWHPNMSPYLYGVKSKIHIIDLDKSLVMLNNSLKYIRNLIHNKKQILFVGTKLQARDAIAKAAMSCGMPYVNHRWLGGMLTNFDTLKKSIKKMEELSLLLADPNNNLSKKELLDLSRKVEKMQKVFNGVVNMKHTPDAVFLIDIGMHHIALTEARKLGIKVIGVVDSNNNPKLVDSAITGNDDSSKAISIYLNAVADTILKAKQDADDFNKDTKITEDIAEPKTHQIH